MRVRVPIDQPKKLLRKRQARTDMRAKAPKLVLFFWASYSLLPGRTFFNFISSESVDRHLSECITFADWHILRLKNHQVTQLFDSRLYCGINETQQSVFTCPFLATIFEYQNSWNGSSELHKVCRMTDFEALTLQKARSGIQYGVIMYCTCPAPVFK